MADKIKRYVKRIIWWRFHVFFFSQLLILFGAMFIPSTFFNSYVSPMLLLINVASGALLFMKRSRRWQVIGLFFLLLLLLLLSSLSTTAWLFELNIIRFSLYFLFYFIVTAHLITQVWRWKEVDQRMILGLISGYVSLGLLGFFLCLGAETIQPGAFSIPANGIPLVQNLIYFSYITLMTVGYGDIQPTSLLAQKIVVFIAMTGQIYLVVFMGVVLGKYMRQRF